MLLSSILFPFIFVKFFQLNIIMIIVLLSHCLSSFALIFVTFTDAFKGTWKILFLLPKVQLLKFPLMEFTNSFSFCFSENLFILPFFLKDCSRGKNDFLSALRKMEFHSLLASVVFCLSLALLRSYPSNSFCYFCQQS